MTILVACPKCQTKLKVEDNVLGRNIKCPACAAVFAVKAPGSSTSAAAPPPAKTAPTAPLPKKAPPPDDDDDDRPAPRSKARAEDGEEEAVNPRPRASAKPPVDEEEDDRPRKASPRKARADDDEEDDRPRKSSGKRSRADDDDEDRRGKKEKKKGGGAGKVLLIIGAVLLLGCGGCGGVCYLIYVKVNEGLQGVFTDIKARSTAPEFQGATVKTGPVKPPRETKKASPDTAKRSEGPKPPGDEQPRFASAQQFADAMVDHMDAAFGQYVKQPLQLTGAATKVNLNADGLVEEVWFQPQVDDLKLGVKKPFAINCRLSKPVPVAGLRVGATVTVRGRLTGGSLGSATLNECVIIASADGPAKPPDKPGPPTKPGKEPLILKADEFGKDLYEGKQTAYARYARQPLQIEGTVHEQKLAPGGGVAEVTFQLDVKDAKTGLMKPFLIHCKFSTPLPGGDKAADLAAGKTVTVRGKLGGVSYIGRSATINECVLVEPGVSP